MGEFFDFFDEYVNENGHDEDVLRTIFLGMKLRIPLLIKNGEVN
jgi:hypothetical protein